MNYLISASTDIGIKKATNQDSLSVKTLNTQRGRMVFAVLCDGMGGLQKGEVASAVLVGAFLDWMIHRLPALCVSALEDYIIRSDWESIIASQNERIRSFGKKSGITLGTTAAVLLLTEDRFYALNVGDSRIYEISDHLQQITKDQTVIAREIELGHITEEEARTDPRRSVLLQCVGASPFVNPDMFFGDTRQNAVYMLCSDGFRHEITPEEIFCCFHPDQMIHPDMMKYNTDKLIEINKERMEQDNISVVTIRTF